MTFSSDPTSSYENYYWMFYRLLRLPCWAQQQYATTLASSGHLELVETNMLETFESGNDHLIPPMTDHDLKRIRRDEVAHSPSPVYTWVEIIDHFQPPNIIQRLLSEKVKKKLPFPTRPQSCHPIDKQNQAGCRSVPQSLASMRQLCDVFAVEVSI